MYTLGELCSALEWANRDGLLEWVFDEDGCWRTVSEGVTYRLVNINPPTLQVWSGQRTRVEFTGPAVTSLFEEGSLGRRISSVGQVLQDAVEALNWEATP